VDGRQPVFPAFAASLPAVLSHPGVGCVQRQRIQERAGDPDRVQGSRAEQRRHQLLVEPGCRSVHPAVLPVFRQRRAMGREERKVGPDPQDQVAGSVHHASGSARLLAQQPAVPARRVVPDGFAKHLVRSGEILGIAAIAQARRIARRQRVGRSRYVSGDPARHACRRRTDGVVRQRHGLGFGRGDRYRAGRLRHEPRHPGDSGQRTGAAHQPQPIHADAAHAGLPAR